MTAKEFVKQKYPNAKAERHVRGMIKGMQEVFRTTSGKLSY